MLLEEVGALPMGVRARMLDSLRERRFHPLGSDRTVPLNARILATTARDLDEVRREGRFQDDTVADLNLQIVHVPPLRERREDIPALVKIFVAWYNRKYCRTVERIPETVQNQWVRQDWPGNVWDLRYTVERAVVRSTGSTLEP